FRGIKGAKVLSNTVVTQSAFAVFRFTWGGSGSGVKIGNDDVEVANNIIVAKRSPQAARNDGNPDLHARFGPQLWAGRFGRVEGAGLPRLPGEDDAVVASGEEAV